MLFAWLFLLYILCVLCNRLSIALLYCGVGSLFLKEITSFPFFVRFECHYNKTYIYSFLYDKYGYDVDF